MNDRPKCKAQTVIFVEDNLEANLKYVGLDNEFSDITSEALSMKENIYKLNFIKI